MQIAEQRQRTQRHHEILRRMKQEREAQEELRRQEEHEQLLATVSMDEQPFLFVADEVLLLIFSFLSARDVNTASRVCRRCVASSYSTRRRLDACIE